MGDRIGIIAGSGMFPFLAIEDLKKKGYSCYIAGIEGEAQCGLAEAGAEFEWVKPGELGKLLSFLKNRRISKVLMAGKVSQVAVFREEQSDETAFRWLAGIKEKSPSTLISRIIDFMEREGIQVVNPGFLLSPYFCRREVLTETKPSDRVLEDIRYGLKIARIIADQEIGQTVIVKGMAVVAVEGMEGTDAAILRAGDLAGRGIVAVKVSRTSQDMRVDVPAVGLETVKLLVQVKAAALCIEAGRVAFFQREEAVSLADAHQLVLMAAGRKDFA